MSSETITDFYRKIELEDVDRAIITWFDKTVDAHVKSPSGDRTKVAVVFSSGERWFTARDQKGVRDKNGKLILPMIGIRRTAIDPVEGMNALGVNVPRIQVSRKVSDKTNELQNQIQNRSIASRRLTEGTVYEVTTIPFPYNGITSYELVIQAQYMQQMNDILQKIFVQLESMAVPSFVAPLAGFERQPGALDVASDIGLELEPSVFEEQKPLNGYYFVGFFDPGMADGGNLSEFTDQERIVKYTATFTVPTYLHLDPEGKTPAVRRERTAFKIGFKDENVCFVDDLYELDLIFGPLK